MAHDVQMGMATFKTFQVQSEDGNKNSWECGSERRGTEESCRRVTERLQLGTRVRGTESRIDSVLSPQEQN